jgi:O-antigen ligase/tetratricopeptide (TPR) repeat protein
MRAVVDCLLLAPGLLPLLFIPAFLFPFASPKSIGFRSLGVLLLAALVWLLLAREPLHFGRLRHRPAWIPAALLVVAYLASLQGVAFHHSFWSSFERGDGLLTLSVAILYFYAILLHADAQFLRRFAIMSMWVGGGVALYAVVEWFQIRTRVGSTFGNAAFMASYLAMTFFLTLWLARGYRDGARVFAFANAGLQLLAILLSATRGTIVALVLAGVVAAAHVAWRGREQPRLVARVVLAGCVAGLGLFIAFREQLAQVPVEFVQRFTTMSAPSDTSAVRLVLWERIGRKALDHPLAGVGAEHIDHVYNRAYSPELITGDWNDHSHNAYLDYFVQFGVAGFLLYGALVVIALWAARAVFKAGDVVGGYLFLLFLTYAVQNFFVFDVALTLWMFLAVLACVLAAGHTGQQRPAIPDTPFAARLVLVPAILLLLFPVTVQPARASILAARVVNHGAADPEQEARDIRKGLALDTYGDFEYGYAAYNNYAFTQERSLSGGALVLAHQTTKDVLARNLVRYPYDVRTAVYLAHIIDRTPAGAMLDFALLGKAADAVRRVSPHHSEAWYYPANALIRLGDAAGNDAQRNMYYQSAIVTLEEYAALEPRLSTPRFAIANLYLNMGDAERSRTWAESADAIHRPDVYAARVAGDYYLKARDWSKAARYLGEVARGDMTDYPMILDLARARMLSGDKAGARQLVEHLRRNSPATLATNPDLMAGFAALN